MGGLVWRPAIPKDPTRREGQQGRLFGPLGDFGQLTGQPVPARAGHATQQAAAKKVLPHVAGQKLRVLTALARRGPMTREQLAPATGIKETTLCARLKSLVDPNRSRPAILPQYKQLVREADYLREAASGVMVTVYEITVAGLSLTPVDAAGDARPIWHGRHRDPRRRRPPQSHRGTEDNGSTS